MANGSARRGAAQADARPEGLAQPLVAGGKDQHAARGWGMASNPGTELFCFDARPHLCPLPRGEDFTGHAFRLLEWLSDQSSAGFFQGGWERQSPLLGGEGWVRTVVKLTFGGRHKWLVATERSAGRCPAGRSGPAAGGRRQRRARRKELGNGGTTNLGANTAVLNIKSVRRG